MLKNLENYINKSKNNSSFKFIKDVKLQEILYLFSWYIFFIYFEEIKNIEYSEETKEIKAHTIFVYLWSIIESIVYDFVKSKLNDNKSKRKYLELEDFIEHQKIKDTKLYICKKKIKEISLNDSISFNALINWARDKKIIDEKIIKKIDSFRKMRNMIHINAFLDSSEEKLIEKLEKAFIETKEIIDYIEEKI